MKWKRQKTRWKMYFWKRKCNEVRRKQEITGENERLWPVADNLRAQNTQYEVEVMDLAATSRQPAGKLRLQKTWIGSAMRKMSSSILKLLFLKWPKSLKPKRSSLAPWMLDPLWKGHHSKKLSMSAGLSACFWGKQPGQGTCSKLTEKLLNTNLSSGSKLKDSEATRRELLDDMEILNKTR